MNLYEIDQLRNSGQVEEAYHECLQLWQSNSENRDIRIVMARCLKALAEQVSQAGQADEFIEIFKMLAKLRLDEVGEVSTANFFVWHIHVILDKLSNNPGLCVATANRLLDILPQLHFVKPHSYYSMLADTMVKVKGAQNTVWQRFPEFMDWFGFDNFMPNDYERIRLKNGKSIPSIVERAHNCYFKALMASIERQQIHPEKLYSFINRLTKLQESHPEYQYTLYHKAQLLLTMHEKEKALEAIRPFVKKKMNDFWVWDVLSETVDDVEIKLSCCCKALTCKTDEKFLGRVHLKAAQLMHELGYNNHARAELRAMHKVYEANKWRMPREAYEMKQQDWYQQAQAPTSNTDFYQKHTQQCEDLLFLDTPEMPILVTYYHAAKHVCKFVTANKEQGFFYTKGLKVRFADHTLYKIRINNAAITNDKPTQVITCEPLTDIYQYIGVFFKKIDGRLNVKEGQHFGFVDSDIFVNLNQLSTNAKRGDDVVGTAVISYNTKKEKWGWKAISLKKK